MSRYAINGMSNILQYPIFICIFCFCVLKDLALVIGLNIYLAHVKSFLTV